MADLDEELQQRQEIEQERAENFSAAQQQDQLQRQQAEAEQEQQEEQQNNSPVNQLKNVAKDQVKQAGKKIAKKAIQETIVATAPYWGTALLILAGIALILFVVIAVPVAVCNSSVSDSGSISGAAATAGAKAIFTATGICQQLAAITQTATQNAPALPQGQPAGNDASNRVLLAQYGITVNKANCVSTTQTDCTSLDKTKSLVINEIIQMTQACDISLGGNGTQNKCGVIVTGGSEAGHADPTGVCSHADGDKMDVSASQALTTYIQNKFTPSGGRGGAGGGARFADPNVTSSFVLESAPAHWDISVGCIG